MASLTLVIHERRGAWARHLRPRLLSWPIRWVETRSTDDLESALAGTASPIVVIDLARRVRAGLEDLDRAVQRAPDAMTLVLDPEAREGVGVRVLARELGATHVISGVATPPRVAGLLARWLPLARRQAESQGWSNAPPPEPEPWSWLNPLLEGRTVPLRVRAARS